VGRCAVFFLYSVSSYKNYLGIYLSLMLTMYAALRSRTFIINALVDMQSTDLKKWSACHFISHREEHSRMDIEFTKVNYLLQK